MELTAANPVNHLLSISDRRVSRSRSGGAAPLTSWTSDPSGLTAGASSSKTTYSWKTWTNGSTRCSAAGIPNGPRQSAGKRGIYRRVTSPHRGTSLRACLISPRACLGGVFAALPVPAGMDPGRSANRPSPHRKGGLHYFSYYPGKKLQPLTAPRGPAAPPGKRTGSPWPPSGSAARPGSPRWCGRWSGGAQWLRRGSGAAACCRPAPPWAGYFPWGGR